SDSVCRSLRIRKNASMHLTENQRNCAAPAAARGRGPGAETRRPKGNITRVAQLVSTGLAQCAAGNSRVCRERGCCSLARYEPLLWQEPLRCAPQLTTESMPNFP